MAFSRQILVQWVIPFDFVVAQRGSLKVVIILDEVGEIAHLVILQHLL